MHQSAPWWEERATCLDALGWEGEAEVRSSGATPRLPAGLPAGWARRGSNNLPLPGRFGVPRSRSGHHRPVTRSARGPRPAAPPLTPAPPAGAIRRGAAPAPPDRVWPSTDACIAATSCASHASTAPRTATGAGSGSASPAAARSPTTASEAPSTRGTSACSAAKHGRSTACSTAGRRGWLMTCAEDGRRGGGAVVMDMPNGRIGGIAPSNIKGPNTKRTSTVDVCMRISQGEGLGVTSACKVCQWVTKTQNWA